MLEKNLPNRIVRLVVYAVAFVALCAFLTFPAFAQTGMQFQVFPIATDDQDTSAGFYNIKTKPGQVYNLQMEVVNTSSTESIYEVSVTNTDTTESGEVNYDTVEVSDESLVYPMTTLLQVEGLDADGRITIPGNSSQMVSFTLSAPTQSYPGVLLGGIKVLDVTQRLEREQNKQANPEQEFGMNIYQEYQTIVAVKLHDNETPVAPNFELTGLKADSYNYRAAIIASIRNSEPILAKKALFSASISPKGSEEFTFKVENKIVDFAPNSVMDYTFTDAAGYGLAAGTYVFYGTLEYEGQIWEFNDELVIEQAQAQAINDSSLNLQGSTNMQNNTFLILMLFVIVFLILLILLIVLILLKTRKNKENK